MTFCQKPRSVRLTRVLLSSKGSLSSFVHFKPAGRYWCARVGLHYRALSVRNGDEVIWFWIGTHAEYDRLLR